MQFPLHHLAAFSLIFRCFQISHTRAQCNERKGAGVGR